MIPNQNVGGENVATNGLKLIWMAAIPSIVGSGLFVWSYGTFNITNMGAFVGGFFFIYIPSLLGLLKLTKN